MQDVLYDLSPLPGPQSELPYTYHPPVGSRLDLPYTIPSEKGVLELPAYDQDA